MARTKITRPFVLTHLNCVLWASKTNVYDVVFFLLKAKKNIGILPYNRFPCEWPISNPTFSCKTCLNAPEIEHFYSDKIRGNEPVNQLKHKFLKM